MSRPRRSLAATRELYANTISHRDGGDDRHEQSTHDGSPGFRGVAAAFRPHDARCRRADRGHRRGVCASLPVWCVRRSSTRRIAEHRAVLERSEPFAYAAQNLYAALSAADAAAASAFLSGGNQTPPMRARYQQALADAAASLVDATAGASDPTSRTAVAEISTQLAAYTGLVEAARANNVQGFPIGSAYLREASSLMQTKLLPEAKKIYSGHLTDVEERQRAIGSTPMVGLALLALVPAVIAVGSVIIYSRTNRQFNLGLVAAAVVALLAIGWIVVATRMAADDIGRSQAEGTARFGHLAEARILAHKPARMKPWS